jgi:hypothetical protein
MTLHQATVEASAAAETGDLERLARALKARAEAIARGERSTPAIVAEGRRVEELLRSLIRQTILDASRLKQIQDGFVPPSRGSAIDLAG